MRRDGKELYLFGATMPSALIPLTLPPTAALRLRFPQRNGPATVATKAVLGGSSFSR